MASWLTVSGLEFGSWPWTLFFVGSLSLFLNAFYVANAFVGEFSVHMAKLFAIDCEELWSTHPGPVFDRSGIAAILWVAASLLTEPLLCP